MQRLGVRVLRNLRDPQERRRRRGRDQSGCNITTGAHTAEFVAEKSFATCGAVCYFAEPGNWGTSHSFTIGE